jgi:hypothetical protein
MELIDVLQAILDKAGNKDYYIDVSVDKEDGEICGACIRLSEVSNNMPEAIQSDDRAGKVTMHETDRAETTVKPSVAKSIKDKLKI